MKGKMVLVVGLVVFGITIMFAGCASISSGANSRNANSLQNLTVHIDIPDNWLSVPSRGVPFSDAETQDYRITPQSGEKAALMLTIGRLNSGISLSVEQFLVFFSRRVNSLLPNAVETNPDIVRLSLNGGVGIYCTLTDASLVKVESLAEDDYRFVTLYLARYERGFFVHASILTDNITNETFQQMLDILFSIHI